jgi:hypothetical protein
MQRGKAGRKQAAGKQTEKDLGLTGAKEESARIAKMQAVQRGRAQRKELKEQEQSVMKIQVRMVSR